MQTCLKNPIFTTPGVSQFNPTRTQIRSVIFCARKRRQPSFLNRKARKLILDTALAIASNLNVVPPPVTALIQELGGGSGGGLGIRRGGGGGGGFGWWRRRARNLGFVLLAVVIGLGLCAVRKVSNDVVLCGFGVAAVGGLIGCWDARIGDWVLGFCSCAGLVCLSGLRGEDVRKLVEKLGACVKDSGMIKLLAMKGFKSRPF